MTSHWTAIYGHWKAIYRRMKEEFQVSLKIAGKVTEETFIWIKGRGSFNNDVSQAITFSLWEVVET